ncbi:hypothetical protein C6P45_004010 [Maudiozyma exigua]|uniref:Uncharacterized protein n=1 Tax=Maudiozyma exigua TaxID=34358 RepID=A0A9P6VS59_MAUEX|nr:hypothetical protein C6P45_004010 [Kazachstania exigua]
MVKFINSNLLRPILMISSLCLTTSAQSALLEGESAEEYSSWKPAHRSDTWTAWQSDPDDAYMVLVTSYFENGTELAHRSFRTSVPTQIWLNSTDPNLLEYRYQIPVVFEEPPMIDMGSHNFVSTINVEVTTEQALPTQSVGSVTKRGTNCGYFCGNTAHCSGSNKRCQLCRSLQWSVGWWQKQCVL